MLLSVNNLHVAYGAIVALRDVSIKIDRGEIVALIGANGAGKTTLLRAISGLVPVAAGQILWRDKLELANRRADRIVRAGISHVPEGRQVFPHMTVRENLQLGGYLRSRPWFWQEKRERSLIEPTSGQSPEVVSAGKALDYASPIHTVAETDLATDIERMFKLFPVPV